MASAQTTSKTMSVWYRTVDGVRIRCAESDGPPDRTVVLTSPWPESVYAFAPIWSLLGRRFRLFAVDLPGFGASERRDDLLSPRAMGAFLLRLVDECELGRPHLVAPDVGTSAALFAVASSPEAVASVVVGSGGVAVPIALGEPLKGWVLDADVERFRSVDSAAIVTAALDTVAGHVFPNAIREDYLESYAGDRFFESIRYARRYPEELPALAQLLPELETPVLIFAGLRDRVVPPVNAEFLAERIPFSRLAPIECGHFVWEEASDRFAAMIAAWVTGGYRKPGGADN
ncbi:MAG TPA: alpha/beta hydrolase [Solirubrobacteraceae bacterium]|nr:alpha/beta hydrolase [Solirubrobacteraceae bacterium]